MDDDDRAATIVGDRVTLGPLQGRTRRADLDVIVMALEFPAARKPVSLT